MLEKIQVPPCVLDRVVGLAKNPALGAWEKPSPFKANVYVQPLVSGGEDQILDDPRRFQPKGSSKKFLLSHKSPSRLGFRIIPYPHKTARSHLKTLLGEKGYTLKNSSIDSSKPNEAKNPDYIKQLLRSRIEWAGTTIALIGPQTHTREWVDWEIEQSNKVGNRIVGVFINGASDADVPKAFEKYGDALVGWRSEGIIDAIEGRCDNFEKPDGSPWENRSSPSRSEC